VLPFDAVRARCEHVFVPRYSEAELRAVVAQVTTLTEVLCHFGLRPAGGNFRLLKRWLDEWGISTAHFEGTPPPRRRAPVALEQVLVAGSSYPRTTLKRRLYAEGLKRRECEMCGQGERWQGARMSLILDHINGVADDNRLENLRIVCPNCDATLDTHCGRANRLIVEDQACLRCGALFTPAFPHQRYCSRACGSRYDRKGVPRPGARRVQRPPYERLVAEVAARGWSAVGRKYGVSDNAVRKWVRAYERTAGGDGGAGTAGG
jgi:hypothetical protein